MPEDREAPDALPADWTRRYLNLLGLEQEAPSLEALTRLVRTHVLTVPFENATVLIRRAAHPPGPIPHPDPVALLDTWERKAGTGVCFDIMAMLVPLLRALGYRATLILGQVSSPFGHQAIVVHFGEDRYLLDLGNGAPMFTPIPLNRVTEIHRHGLGFRFRPNDQRPRQLGREEWVRDSLIDGAWKPSARFEMQPAADADRDAGYQHHLTPGTTWVLGTLTMSRSTTEEVFSLRDDTLVRYTEGGKETSTLTSPADYRRVATDLFGLPGLPIDDALAVRAALASAPS